MGVAAVIDYYGDNQDTIIPNAGPGQWNDPDMLIIGNFGLSYEQSKTQMAMWAIPILPVYKGKYSYAIVFLNRRTDGTPSEVSVTLSELGLDHRDGYHILD